MTKIPLLQFYIKLHVFTFGKQFGPLRYVHIYYAEL